MCMRDVENLLRLGFTIAEIWCALSEPGPWYRQYSNTSENEPLGVVLCDPSYR